MLPTELNLERIGRDPDAKRRMVASWLDDNVVSLQACAKMLRRHDSGAAIVVDALAAQIEATAKNLRIPLTTVS